MTRKARAITVLTALLMAGPAFGDVLTMNCHHANCARSRCDEWNENCHRIGYFEHVGNSFAAPVSHRVCDEWGDCHYAWPTFPPVAHPSDIPSIKEPGTSAPPTPK